MAKAQDEFGQVRFGVVAGLGLDPAGEPSLLVYCDLLQAFQQHALAHAAQTGEADIGGQLGSPTKRRSETAHLLLTAGEEQRAHSGARSIGVASPRIVRHNSKYVRTGDTKSKAVICPVPGIGGIRSRQPSPWEGDAECSLRPRNSSSGLSTAESVAKAGL